MIGRPLRIVLCVLGSALLSIGLVVRAQDDFAAASVGGEGTADELLAFRYATEENFVKARELAGLDELLFRRNSQTGAVEVVSKKNEVVLNPELHKN